MYIWKTASLATEIKSDNIGTNEWKKYYLAMSIFITLTMYLTALAPRENMTVVLVEAIAAVGILIFGVNVTYQSNKGDSGLDYIARMTALSFPISIKLFLLSILFGFLIGFLSEVASLTDTVFEWCMVMFVTAMQVIFFWRINFHLKYINT